MSHVACSQITPRGQDLKTFRAHKYSINLAQCHSQDDISHKWTRSSWASFFSSSGKCEYWLRLRCKWVVKHDVDAVHAASLSQHNNWHWTLESCV
eukprot:scaffold272197_cov35-Tisochrysis_lutea.AAC.1